MEQHCKNYRKQLIFIFIVMKYYFLPLFLFLGTYVSSFAQFQEEYRQTQGFIHPVDFFMIDENKAILFEPLSETETVSLIDLKSGKQLDSIRSGRGPGELSRHSEKAIIRYGDHHFWIWDSGLRREMIVDDQLNLIRDIEVNNQNLHFAIPISEERVASWTSYTRSVLFSVHSFTDYTITEPINTIRYDEFPEYSPVQNNPLSRQGTHYGKWHNGGRNGSTITYLNWHNDLRNRWHNMPEMGGTMSSEIATMY